LYYSRDLRCARNAVYYRKTGIEGAGLGIEKVEAGGCYKVIMQRKGKSYPPSLFKMPSGYLR
jgi:hypothetical protein